jgi:phosphoglucosamine mutase
MAVDGQRELFGTDGIRGVPGEYPLDRETVYKLARALGQVLASSSSSSALKVVLGEDTRESSAWISRWLAGGLQSAGVEVLDAGVITTPGVAFLTRHHKFAAGVMVSASHNPYQDNGIKVLSNSGMKIPESAELEIERLLRMNQVAGGQIREAPLKPIPELLEDYLGFLEGLAHPSLGSSPMRLVADCAHGACFRVLPELARRLAISTRILNAAPNGRNINLHCGSLHPEMMAQETKSSGADLGVAFDGDGVQASAQAVDERFGNGPAPLHALDVGADLGLGFTRQ